MQGPHMGRQTTRPWPKGAIDLAALACAAKERSPGGLTLENLSLDKNGLV